LNSEQELEGWAELNNIPLSPELYLANQRALILQELDMVDVYVDLPGTFLESLDSQQFAEVVAGAVKRAVNRKTIGHK
jgi:hypothetical protein